MRTHSHSSTRILRRPTARRRGTTAIAAIAVTLWWSATASAQLDPLLFLKRVPPTIIIVVDNSLRSLEDGSGNYYDPNNYVVSADPFVASALNVPGASSRYRRKYVNLLYENFQDASSKFQATDILAVGDTAPGYSTFYDSTRLQIMKSGIDGAVSENAGATFRWGLIKLRQSSPAWRASGNCDKPVRVTGNGSLLLQTDSSPCSAGGLGKYGIYMPSVASANANIEVSLGGGAQVVAPAANTSSSVLSVVRASIGSGGLIPAGAGSAVSDDRPISHALDDARTAVINSMAADTAANRSCRNIIVVLVAGGADSGDAAYKASHNPEAIATTFLSVSSSGTTRKVPIHVVGVKPSAADVSQLRNIAANSGGVYTAATTASDVQRAINYAVQTGFARATDVELGQTSEYLPVSPVVGTVNLKGASDANGASLANTDITASPGGQALPQRSNVLLSAGFTLPGFHGALRAFRAYKPVADPTKPTGWKFSSDGTRLWPDLDGRPQLAGMARVPSDPNSRNIYTYIPDGSGGGSVVAFTTGNAATILPHMGASATSSLITLVRAQALGAIIGSTPAMMDAPSLDPPPDDDYGRSDAPDSFAGTYKDRRTMIFFGANDGMIHAVDARTGYEVWAFIPYNLLPKLKTLADGQPVEQFEYFVDSSPKIAEVKMNGSWRSMLIIGEGPGGTFYQAFDVTEAGMGVDPTLDGVAGVSSMLGKFDSPNESIVFKWAFPNYSNFEPTYAGTFTVTDGTPGGRVRLYGDLKSSATYAEKTVGFTWSDPAVGALDANRVNNVAIVGSGYFPDIEMLLTNRGAAAPKAGNAMYLLDLATGKPLGNASGATCPIITSGSGEGTGCASIGDVSNGRKNALQADPTASGDSGTFYVKKAYIGDIDGKYWRFNFTDAGKISANLMTDTSAPIYASSALLFIGSTDVYMFFATGSDILPTTAPGGTGIFKLYGLKDNSPASGATIKFERALATVSNVSGIATGERPSTSPSVAGDIVFYTTTTESATTPCSDFSAKLYGLTYTGGAAYDGNNNGKIESTDAVAATLAGRATAPFIVDQHLYIGTPGDTGANVKAFGDPEDFNNGVGQVGVRILSWREIR